MKKYLFRLRYIKNTLLIFFLDELDFSQPSVSIEARSNLVQYITLKNRAAEKVPMIIDKEVHTE